VPALSEDAWNLVQIKRKEEEAEEAAWAAQDEAGDAGVGYGQDEGEEEDEGQEYYGNEEEEEYEEELMREVGSLLVLEARVMFPCFSWRPNGRLEEQSRVPRHFVDCGESSDESHAFQHYERQIRQLQDEQGLDEDEAVELLMRQSRGEGRYDEPEEDGEEEQEDYERPRRPDSRIDGGGGGGLRPGEGSGDESAYTEEDGDSYSQSDRTLSQVTHLTVRSSSSCPTSCTARVEISRCDALSNREKRNPGASNLWE
jgi:hypothetical protein